MHSPKTHPSRSLPRIEHPKSIKIPLDAPIGSLQPLLPSHNPLPTQFTKVNPRERQHKAVKWQENGSHTMHIPTLQVELSVLQPLLLHEPTPHPHPRFDRSDIPQITSIRLMISENLQDKSRAALVEEDPEEMHTTEVDAPLEIKIAKSAPHSTRK